MEQAAHDVKSVTRAERIAMIEDIERENGMPRWLRDAVIAALPAGHEARRKVEAVEERIATLRGW